MDNKPQSEAIMPQGIFRKCRFSDGTDSWVAALFEEHQQGELVPIGKRDGSLTRVVLGQRVPVFVGNRELPFCYVIGPKVAAPCHHAPKFLPDGRPWLKDALSITVQ
jgi:hypothetical protein